MDFAFGAERTVAACPGMKHRALFAPILRAYGVSIQAWRSPRQLTACKGRQARQHAIQSAMLVFVFRAWGVWGCWWFTQTLIGDWCLGWCVYVHAIDPPLLAVRCRHTLTICIWQHMRSTRVLLLVWEEGVALHRFGQGACALARHLHGCSVWLGLMQVLRQAWLVCATHRAGGERCSGLLGVHVSSGMAWGDCCCISWHLCGTSMGYAY